MLIKASHMSLERGMSKLMNIKEVDGKIEYLIIPKGTKFVGSDKLELRAMLL